MLTPLTNQRHYQYSECDKGCPGISDGRPAQFLGRFDHTCVFSHIRIQFPSRTGDNLRVFAIPHYPEKCSLTAKDAGTNGFTVGAQRKTC